MSKILIISQSDFEFSTNEVCDWLNFYKVDYFRLNVDKIYDSNYYHIHLDVLGRKITLFDVLQKKHIYLEQVKIVWCRRFINKIKHKILQENNLNYNTFEVADFISNEINNFLKVLFNLYPHWKWLDNPNDIARLNKIEVLKKAYEFDINVPKSYILNDANFYDYEHSMITKPIYEATTFTTDDGVYATHTQEINKMKIANKSFLPSFVQDKIEKKFEIRSFYFDETFYSLAIFSNSNAQTSVDFRKYDFSMPNRMIAYTLPQEIQKKLKKLMEFFNLSTGSIDLIKSKTDGKFYFLEINPIGQFGMLSQAGNYFLEKKIAEYLINKSNEIK